MIVLTQIEKCGSFGEQFIVKTLSMQLEAKIDRNSANGLRSLEVTTTRTTQILPDRRLSNVVNVV